MGGPSMPTHETGFVYVLSNQAMPDIVKIGFSTRLSEDRARELSTTSLPYPFEVMYRAATSQPRKVEQAVHRLLVDERVTPNREFFRVSVETAVGAIRRCELEVAGVEAWAQVPEIHRLRAGDRLALPLRAGQMFALTAHRQIFSTSAEILDLWQAHSDGDVLEIHATEDPGHVAGLSDGDPGGEEDPVPYLDRSGDVANGTLIGRERLVAGDRLIWLADTDDPARCRSVVFESDGFCQVTCRTWNPQRNPVGMPLLLNDWIREASPAMTPAIRRVLALGIPRSWAPRTPDPADGWAEPATHPQAPEYWLPQLRPRGGKR